MAYLMDPIDNKKSIEYILEEINKYMSNISKTNYIAVAKKQDLLDHLKKLTNYIVVYLPLNKEKNKNKNKNKKNKSIITNFFYFLSKLRFRNYIDDKIIKKIYILTKSKDF
jgi:GTPase involved in cell partitioning and DNA repair